MPSPAATTHAPYRPRLSSVIGAAFVGSTLIAVMAPAHADPAGSATVTFARSSDTVEVGTEVAPNAVSVTNTGDAAICLMSLATNASEFMPREFEGGLVDAGGARSFGVVGGAPRQDTDVIATLTYTLADPETGCGGISVDTLQTADSNTWTVRVTDPEPSPPPTETPTEEPTGEPTEEPTRTPSPSPTPTDTDTPTTSPSESDTPEPTPTNTDAPAPSATATEGDAGGGSGNGRSPSNSPDRSPRPNVSSVPTSGADIPTLPRNEADLPDLAPGSAEDLADLPLVTPSSEDTETETASDHTDLGPSVTPAVLLAAFLLALLLAAPLGPARRVRLGSGYQGKRRRG